MLNRLFVRPRNCTIVGCLSQTYKSRFMMSPSREQSAVASHTMSTISFDKDTIIIKSLPGK